MITICIEYKSTLLFKFLSTYPAYLASSAYIQHSFPTAWIRHSSQVVVLSKVFHSSVKLKWFQPIYYTDGQRSTDDFSKFIVTTLGNEQSQTAADHQKHEKLNGHAEDEEVIEDRSKTKFEGKKDELWPTVSMFTLSSHYKYCSLLMARLVSHSSC